MEKKLVRKQRKQNKTRNKAKTKQKHTETKTKQNKKLQCLKYDAMLLCYANLLLFSLLYLRLEGEETLKNRCVCRRPCEKV